MLAHQLEPVLAPRLGALFAGVLSSSATARLAELLLDPLSLRVAAWGTVVLELSLPFALWWRKTRPVAIVAGLLLHVFLALLLEVYTFSIVMVASYLLFLDPEALPRAVRQLLHRGNRRHDDRRPATV